MGRCKQIAGSGSVRRNVPLNMDIRLRAAQKSAPFYASPIKKPNKRKQRAIQEIKTYQRSTDLLIPRASFERLVREVLSNIPYTDHIQRMEPRAIEALQEAAEAFIVEIMDETNLMTLHRFAQTISPRDMALALSLRERHGVCSALPSK